MNINEFQALIKPVTDVVSSNAVDAALAEKLNRLFPPGGETFDAIEKACHNAVADGWMCAEGEEGGAALGPHHRTQSTDRGTQCRCCKINELGRVETPASQRRGMHDFAADTGRPF